MNSKWKVILIISIISIFLNCPFSFAEDTQMGDLREGKDETYLIHLDNDNSDETEVRIDRENRNISIGENSIEYEDLFHDILYEDLTGDNILEAVVITKGEGTSSLLNYSIYTFDENGDMKLIFNRNGIYKGVLYIDDKEIIEKIPIYDKDDIHAFPSEFMTKVYTYDENSFKLASDDIRENDYKENMQRFFKSDGEYYSNPSRKEIERVLEEVAEKKAIPPAVLKAIAYTESNLRQFKDGKPLVSFDGVSYGIMQVTPSIHTEFDEEKLKYDMEYNIEAGAEILLSKWNYAYTSKPWIPRMGNGDPRVLENWYFALWAYNGWVESNNPNMLPYKHYIEGSNGEDILLWTQTKAYQEKVIDYAESQFDQPITKIRKGYLPKKGLPNRYDVFKTPTPYHTCNFKDYEYEDFIINMTRYGLSLRDDDWEKIGSLAPRDAMIVLEGPELYNGYLRYRVRTIDEDNEGEIGWVAMNWLQDMNNSDVNCDGKINEKDICAVEDKIGSNKDIEVYDMNYNNKIDRYDVSLIRKKYEISTANEGYEVFPKKLEVSTKKDWIIEFNKELDEETINDDNIFIEDKFTGEKVANRVELLGDKKAVKIHHPNKKYLHGNIYKIKIIDGVRSHDKKKLSSPIIMEFWVK